MWLNNCYRAPACCASLPSTTTTCQMQGKLNKSAGHWALGCPFSEVAVHRETRIETLLSGNRKGFLFLFFWFFSVCVLGGGFFPVFRGENCHLSRRTFIKAMYKSLISSRGICLLLPHQGCWGHKVCTAPGFLCSF